MKVEIVEHDERYLALRIEDVNHGVVNALRRTLVADVPKLAIEDVTIYDNNSALFDEIIAHRLGLLPIPTDLKAFGRRDECTCEGEGCSNCTVLFTLTSEGPGTVYGRDLQPTDPEFAVAEPDVPIVKLTKDQRLMLEATAILGSGRDHAKWTPVSGCGYKEWPTMEISGPLTMPPQDRRELAMLLPADAVEISDDGEIEVKDELKAAQVLYAARGMYDLDNIEFGHLDGVFHFQFETDGSLTAKDALQTAINLLMDKLKAVEDAAPDLEVAVEA